MRPSFLPVVVAFGCASLFACTATVQATPPPAAPPPAAAPAPAPAPAVTAEESLDVWSDHHAVASRELGDWVRAYPKSARVFFDWDGHHPERAHEFVTWSIQHPGDGFDVFFVTHRAWEQFDEIGLHHRPAVESFMQWCRRHPEAAESLMRHEHGLEWAGHHLYQASWDMGAAPPPPAPAPPPPAPVATGGGAMSAEESLEVWSDRNPEASRELGNWTREYKKSARFFFEWDSKHPERAREFVTWAITHPGEGIEAFIATHRGWEYFDNIVQHHRAAANAFIAWCRRHPKASESLMRHDRGLDWAGHHLFQASWDMKE